MGCDIHAFYEIKVDDEWIGYGEADFGRNYDFFARLANVRNYSAGKITPIDIPRGLPDDVSKLVALHSNSWDVDGHSHSWISSDEYTLIMTEFKPETLKSGMNKWSPPGGLYLFSNDFHSWSLHSGEYPEFLQDFRLVFWFDN